MTPLPLLIDLDNELNNFISIAKEVEEYRYRIVINGEDNNRINDLLNGFFKTIDNNQLSRCITVKINEEGVGSEDFSELIEDGVPVKTWQILLSKEKFLNNQLKEDNITTIWFLTQANFSKWIKGIKPFEESSNIFRQKEATRILVSGLSNAFGGHSLAVDGIKGNSILKDWPMDYQGPDENIIRQQVHLITGNITVLDPRPFILTWGDVDSSEAEPFRQHSAQLLLICLTQEFYSSKQVVLKGAKRLELPLFNDNDSPPSHAQLKLIAKAVNWMYEERSEVRGRLIADRLTLDIKDGQSLWSGSCDYLQEALKQSTEQYKFVIQERKDEYAKELRGLLKDVQQQSSFLSEQLRRILNGLLRDVLASLLLISLGLFTRMVKTSEVLASKEADILFKALAFYFLISFTLQLLTYLRDFFLSKKELKYWAKASRDQLGIDEIEKHLNFPLKERRCNFYVMVVLFFCIYILLIFYTFNLQSVLKYFGII